MKKELKFREDGTFKIVQITDLHIGADNGNVQDQKTFRLIDEILEKEMPDLIAITGDLIWSTDDGTVQNYKRVLDHVSKWDIPFAIVYGNHDSEANTTREELYSMQEEYKNSIAEHGPEAIHGVGNYTLSIKSHNSEAAEALLYFLDSGAYAPEQVGGYEWIHADQVNWFVSESRKYKEVPSLAFFHIPLPEYKDVLQVGSVSGNKLEQICSPNINSGLYTAILEEGIVLGTFVGHDHDNDYCGVLNNIALCYGRITGYNVYGTLERGARVIRLFEGENRFETWLRLAGGAIVIGDCPHKGETNK
jgi:hypothetical protein